MGENATQDAKETRNANSSPVLQAGAPSTLEADTPEATRKPTGHDVGGIRIRVLNTAMIVLAGFVALMFLQAVQQTSAAYHEFATATDNYITCESAANNMKSGSNYLTTQIRQFVITQDVKYLESYCTEAYETQRREKAVKQLEEYASGKPAHQYLERAIYRSNELMNTEYYAAKLVLESTGGDAGSAAETVNAIKLTSADEALSAEGKIKRAEELVFGDNYQHDVDAIEHSVAQCKTSLVEEIDAEKTRNAEIIDGLLTTQQVLTWALVAVAIVIIVSIIVLILWPIREYVVRIGKNQALPVTGANELRIMADEYNALYAENLKHSNDLRRKAEHDHLTGLYNREVFERLLKAYQSEPIALLIVDLDYFKEVNDHYGHDGGDKMLQKLADRLSRTFRSTDFPCRIGGDEFAIIMTDTTPDLAPVISAKVKILAEELADTSDGLPAATLSIGIAFNDGTTDPETLFKQADAALYQTKEAGRNGHSFYKSEDVQP